MIGFRKLGSRVLCLALCLACLTVPALADSQTANEAAASAPSYSSRVHNRASFGSSVVGQLENGTKITVVDETKQFYMIDCYEMNGYIAKEQVTQKDGEYYVNCDPESSETQNVDTVPMADALELRASIMEVGREQLGEPYIAGSKGPYGFDCSGLTSYIYKDNGIILDRAADTQLRDGMIVPRDSLQIGDLVFFRDFGSPWLASHVGIYAGNDQFLHASSSRGVRFDNLDTGYFGARYIGARRVVNVSTEGIEQASNAALEISPLTRSIQGIRTAD